MDQKPSFDRATAAALLLLAVGAALMTFMIIVESEPGLLPLLLVTSGVVALVWAHIRTRRR